MNQAYQFHAPEISLTCPTFNFLSSQNFVGFSHYHLIQLAPNHTIIHGLFPKLSLYLKTHGKWESLVLGFVLCSWEIPPEVLGWYHHFGDGRGLPGGIGMVGGVVDPTPGSMGRGGSGSEEGGVA